MAEKVAQLKTIRRTAHYYWAATWRYKWYFVGIVFFAFTGVMFGSIAYGYLISQLIDGMSKYTGLAGQQSHLMTLLLLFAASQVGTFLSWRVWGILFATQQARTMRDLEQLVFRGLQRHSYRFFTSHFGGALVSQYTRFINAYEDLEDTVMFEVVGALLRMVFSILILIVLLPVIGWSMLAWAALFVVSVGWMAIKKMPLSKKAAAINSKVTARMADAITNALNVKIFAKAQTEIKGFAAISQSRFKARLKSWYVDEVIRTYQAFMMISFELIVLWLSVHLIVTHQASIGSVLLVQLYLGQLYGDLWNDQGRV